MIRTLNWKSFDVNDPSYTPLGIIHEDAPFLHGCLLTPLLVDTDEDGDEIIVVFKEDVVTWLTVSSKVSTVPHLSILLPGLCGCYRHGGKVEVCLN